MDPPAPHRKHGTAAGEQLQLDLRPEVLAEQSPQLDRPVGAARRSPIAVSVHLFHRLFRLPSRRTPGVEDVPDELLQLRADLILEEAAEFCDAARQRSLAGMADALADLVYVAYGAAVTLGIDLDDVIAEVHASNLSKLGPDGRPIMRSDGKVLKPPGFRRPDVERVLTEQSPLPPPQRVKSTSSFPRPA